MSPLEENVLVLWLIFGCGQGHAEHVAYIGKDMKVLVMSLVSLKARSRSLAHLVGLRLIGNGWIPSMHGFARYRSVAAGFDCRRPGN